MVIPMRRIFSALLALVLIASTMMLSSCGETMDTNALVNDAIVATKSADAYEANYAVTVNMHFEGDEDDVYADEIHVLTRDAQTDTPEIILQRTMYILGRPFTFYTYTDSEEWGYVVTSVDTAYKAPYEDVKNSIDTSEITRLLFKYPPMILDNAEVIQNSDGSTTVKFDVEKNLFHELYKRILDSQLERMEVEDSNYIRITNAKGEITVADGMIRDYDLFFDMASDGEKYPRNASVKVELDFLAFGDGVEITPPEGYLDYPTATIREEETAE
jgi:hypothetical protein